MIPTTPSMSFPYYDIENNFFFGMYGCYTSFNMKIQDLNSVFFVGRYMKANSVEDICSPNIDSFECYNADVDFVDFSGADNIAPTIL